jgi:hypothetical protein
MGGGHGGLPERKGGGRGGEGRATGGAVVERKAGRGARGLLLGFGPCCSARGRKQEREERKEKKKGRKKKENEK